MLTQFKRGVDERTSTPKTSRPTTISGSRSRRWDCWTKPSRSSRRPCARPTAGSGRPRRWARLFSTRSTSPSPRRSCAARWTSLGAQRRGKDRPALLAGGSRSRQQRRSKRRCPCYERALAVDIRFPRPRRAGSARLAAGRPMISGTAPVSLAKPAGRRRARLEMVHREISRIIEADFRLITEVNSPPAADAGQDVPAHPPPARRGGDRRRRSARRRRSPP